MERGINALVTIDEILELRDKIELVNQDEKQQQYIGEQRDIFRQILFTSDSRLKLIFCHCFPSYVGSLSEEILAEKDPEILSLFVQGFNNQLEANYVGRALDTIASLGRPESVYLTFCSLNRKHQEQTYAKVAWDLMGNRYYLSKFYYYWRRIAGFKHETLEDADFFQFNGFTEEMLDAWLDEQRRISLELLREVAKNTDKLCSPDTNIIKGRDGGRPEFIVLHSAGAASPIERIALNFLTPNPSVSAHFVVGVDGRVFQFVDLDDGARTNATSAEPRANNYYRLANSKFFSRNPFNANNYTITIECEEFGDHGKLSFEQKMGVCQTIALIREKYDIPLDSDYIIGHNKIAPLHRSYCPGENFSFEQIFDYMLNYAEVEPAVPLNPIELITNKA